VLAFVLSRLLYAKRCRPWIKSWAGSRSKTL
jgi:hypothetical protein